MRPSTATLMGAVNRSPRVASDASLRDRALALRLDNDLSIRAVAEACGVGRSTVGDWLKGVGETRHYRACAGCGERFAASRRHARYCTTTCGNRHRA